MSKKELNVLGIIFDSKLQYSNQVNSLILKSDKALNAIILISRYFNTYEQQQILTSNYFLILYHNCEVQLLHSMHNLLINTLLTALSKALKVFIHYPRRTISYKNLHVITNVATPCMMSNYKLALQLDKTF
jgi:hypothetical protein